VKKTYEGKPREHQIEALVDKFEVNQEFVHEAVRRPIYVMELDRAMYRNEERAIEPPVSLQDQFGNLRGTSDS
jgi:hypothetical protein